MSANSTVKCEACAGSCNGSPIPGVLWNGERCDMCERYQSDASAAARLALCVGEMAEALEMVLESLDETNMPQEWDCRPKIRAVLRKAGLLS